jgi:hypothetical protein
MIGNLGKPKKSILFQIVLVLNTKYVKNEREREKKNIAHVVNNNLKRIPR